MVIEIIWNRNFSWLKFCPQDAGRLFVKWSPGPKTHEKHKISWFLKKKKKFFFFFGRMDENIVTKLILWLKNALIWTSVSFGLSKLPNFLLKLNWKIVVNYKFLKRSVCSWIDPERGIAISRLYGIWIQPLANTIE